MGHLGLLLFSSPVQHRSVETAVGLAEATSRLGHRVSLFFLADAVYATSRALLSAPEETVVHRLAKLPPAVELINCSTCARFRGLGDGDLLPHARNGTLEDLVELMEGCEPFLAFTGEP